jgi:glutamyl endopeptidase
MVHCRLRSSLRAGLFLAVAAAFAAGMPRGTAAQDPGQPVANDGKSITVEASEQPESEQAFEGSSSTVKLAPQVPDKPGLLLKPFQLIWSGLTWFGPDQSHASIIDGVDDRTPVDDPTEFPSRSMVHVVSDLETCSGWLYGKDIVATAGHCVSDGHGRWASLGQVRVVPAHYGEASFAASEPFGFCGASRLYSTVGWTESEDEDYDYGAIKLNCEIGKQTGWLGYGWTALSLVGKPVNVVGYKHVKSLAKCKGKGGDFVLACWGPGNVKDSSTHQLFYSADTSPETSGAPVLDSSACASCALAIHANRTHKPAPSAHQDWNHGAVISRQVFQNLRAWRRLP